MRMHSASSQGSPMPFATFRRSILGMGNDQQIHSMDDSIMLSPDLELFQKQVFTRFHELSAASADEFLSVTWVRKLLDAFVDCQEEFKVIMSNNKSKLLKPPLDRLITEYFDKSVKALDICNATRDGIEKIRLWQKHLEIVISAFDSKKRNVLGEGNFRRARKALMDLAIVMLDVKESESVFSQRNRSFGRQNKGKDHHKPGHSRSLSWSVPHTWSASKQLQSIANNLVPPRANEITSTNGLANTVFTMAFVLMFVLWALVAAVPCQDRGLQIYFTIPRQFSWGTPLYLIHVRIMDESKKRDRKHCIGLLKEIFRMEKSVHYITDLVDSAQFPLTEEQKEDLKNGVEGLSMVCEACKNGLDPLELQLRDAFRKIMSCRTECQELLGTANSH